MRIGNKQLVGPSPVKVKIFRDDGDIDFICGAVLDYSPFDKLCPPPKAPLSTNIATGEETRKINDPRYVISFEKQSNARVDWMVINSLSHTPDLTWENVRLDDPETWSLHEDELRKFLTPNEYGRVIDGVVEANSPSGKRRKEAMDVFSATAKAEPESIINSLVDEHISIASTGSVSDSA